MRMGRDWKKVGDEKGCGLLVWLGMKWSWDGVGDGIERMSLDIWLRNLIGNRNGSKDRKEVVDRLKTTEELELGWDGEERNKMGVWIKRDKIMEMGLL